MVLSGSISPVQRYDLAREAGFSAPNAIVMAAISMWECGNCDMSHRNQSGDIGLWQINDMHGYPADWRADPQNSAKAAYAIWQRQGFNAWCVYPGGCGGPSKNPGQATPAQFAQTIATVTNALGGANVGPMPIPLPGAPQAPALPSGSPPTTGTATATQQTPPPKGVNAGNIGPFALNVPTGLVIGLLGLAILLVGALLFVFNVELRQPTAQLGMRGARISTGPQGVQYA